MAIVITDILLTLSVVTIVVIISASLDPSQPVYAAVDFGNIINLSNNTGISAAPRIIGSPLYLDVVWQDDNTDNFDIFLRRSPDDGATFGDIINLSNNTGRSQLPVINDGSREHVVWSDNTPGNYDIFFKRIGQGSTFGSTINLSNNTGNSVAQQAVRSGPNVYVVWSDNTPGNSDIFLRKSGNGGTTFGPTINLSNNTGSSRSPQVIITPGTSNLYVVWWDDSPGNNDIFFRRSTNNGATFGSIINVSNNPGMSSIPKILSYGTGNVHIVWQDDTPGNFEVFYVRSTNGGATFGSVMNLSNNTGNSGAPQMIRFGPKVYVIWNDETPGNYDVFFRRSTNGGATFDGVMNLSNNTGNSGASPSFPAIARSQSNIVYIVWVDDTLGARNIFFRGSIDGGVTFGDIINISNSTSGNIFNEQIIRVGPNVYVVWTHSAIQGVEYDIYLTKGSGLP